MESEWYNKVMECAGGKTLKLNKSEIRSIILAFVGIAMLLIVFFSADVLNEKLLDYHLLSHTLLELISVAVCVSIFIYGWLTFPYNQSRLLFLITLSFLTIAIFDVLHVITFPGMPFFELSPQVSAWLWMFARWTEASVLMFGLYAVRKNQYIQGHLEKYSLLIIFIFLPLGLSYLASLLNDNLPLLIASVGTTILKNGMEYAIATVHLLAILFIWKQYKETKKISLLNLIRACFFLILCGVAVTLYESRVDAIHILGHVFKVFGYFFIMKAFYSATIQAPLENKKQTEEKLIDVENELELLFKNTDDAIFIYQLNNKQLIQRNPAFTKMFGFSEYEPLTIDCLVPTHLKAEFDQLYSRLENGNSIVDYKTQRQHANGSLLAVSMTVSPMRKHDGEILCASIIRDITEQIKAEEELRETRLELQETLAQHQGIIFKFKESGGEFVYTLIEGKILREGGILPKEVIGRPVQSLYPTSQTELFDHYNRRAWEGEAVEFQFETDDESIYLTSLIPIIREGRIQEVLGTVIDITTLIKTEELLRRSEKLSVVGELAAGFAHEIRNPLTTIKGFLQLIKKDTDTKHSEYMSIMLNEIDRLEMITNEFMVVAKPQVANYQMEDFSSFTENVIQFLQPQALLKNVEMVLHVEEALPLVYCDRNQLRQVFINIYKNAMEAMPDGGIITTSLRVNNDIISISIEDQGTGIPESLIPRLGEPFYTLKEKGTGLGLMVSRKIIENHDGTLMIKSEMNVGTTMTINLPINKKK